MNTPLKTIPLKDRPRERLARYGGEVLSTIELLAIILGSGTKEHSVLILATNLLTHFRSLQKLAAASIKELSEVKGIGKAKAVQLKAVFALGERKENCKEDPLPLIDSPHAAHLLIRRELASQPVETLLVLLRDLKQRAIHREIIGKGTLTEVLLHPREIYNIAVRHRAYSLIIAHNHPSGYPDPSPKDIQMTQLLTQAGQTLGIPLADHLIVSDAQFFSFYREKQGGLDARPVY